MTAGVEGLPTDARDRLAEALTSRWLSYSEDVGEDDLTEHPDRDGARITSGHASLLADVLLPVVRELCDEARAEAARRAGDMLWDKYMGNPAFLRAKRDLYEFADYYGIAPQQQPTCQQRHTTGAITMCCQQPQGHGADVKHQGSDGSEW